MTSDQVDRYLLAREALQAVYELLDFVRAQESDAARAAIDAPLGTYHGAFGTVAVEPDPTYPRATRVRVISRTEEN